MKRICLAFCIFLFLAEMPLSAQTSAGLQYGEAVSAYQRGDDAAAIRLLEPVVRSGALTGAELGRAWLVLGASYHGESKYRAAIHAYDMAIQLLGNDPRTAGGYAAAFRELGVIYRELDDFRAARRLQLKSLQLSQKDHDHAAISRACADLAETSMARKRLGGAERYIACAESESRLASTFDDDDRANMAQVEAEIFLKTRETSKAIDEYRYSIDLFTRRYGENFALTGWSYSLLADAYLQAGMRNKALAAARQGLAIIARTVGTHDPRYGAAEIRYADILDKTGRRAQAARAREQGEATLQAVFHEQCLGCAIDVTAFR